MNSANKSGFLKDLYNEYTKRIYRYMYSRLQNKELAEDLSSETLLKIIKHKDSIDSQKNISAWVFRIARNTIIDHYRKRNDSVNINEEIINEAIGNEYNFDNNILHTEVLVALNELTGLEREVIELTFFAELDSKEISETLNKSLTAIRAIRFRAINKLKKILNGNR